MPRKSIYLLPLVFSLAFLALGCTSPADPTDLTYGGNAQSEEDPVGQITTGVNLGQEAPDFSLLDTYGDTAVLSEAILQEEF